LHSGSWIIHPFLLTIHPITLLVLSNGPVYGVMEVLVVGGVCLLFTTTVFLALDCLLKNSIKAGLLTSLIVVFLAEYSFFDTTLHSERLSSVVNLLSLDRHRYRIGFYAVSLFVIGGFIALTRRKLIRTNQSANVAAIVMTVVAIGQRLPSGPIFGAYHTRAITQALVTAANAETVARQDMPDIYYVILDRYANDHVLRKYLHDDNSAFLSWLVANGFYVASNSVANYPGTLRSVASSLNMDYLERYRPRSSAQIAADGVWSTLYQDNAAVEILKARGYRYLHFGSYWTPTFSNRHADFLWNPLSISSSLLANHLFMRSVIFPVRLRRFLDLEAPDVFDAVTRHSVDPGPKFVFAHILLPHPPYLFSHEGQRVSFADGTTAYVEQLDFATRKAMAMIAAIKQRAQRPYVIILQSDEGPFAKDLFNSQAEADRHFSREEQYDIHGRILYALYAPSIPVSELHQALSPVNTFRLVFNAYFKDQFRILENRNWVLTGFSEGKEDIGTFLPPFSDFTDRVRDATR
jgi:hypothetical protein